RALDLADLVVGAGHRPSLDGGLALEGMRLVGVAVVPVQGPVQRRGAAGAEEEQPETAVVAHDAATRIQSAMPSRKVPTVSAAVTSFHCCTGTLPMVSPVRPFT